LDSVDCYLPNVHGKFQNVLAQQVLEKSCLQAGQKDLRGEARDKSTSGGVFKRYVGATPLGAGMIPTAIERNYPKRLLTAGWWHMSLFQQPAGF